MSSIESNGASSQKGFAPYVLALVICEAIWRDLATKKPTILGCFSVIHGRNFPLTYPQIAAYAAITDGRGKVPLRLRLVDAEQKDEPLFETEVEVEFSDPRAVIELDFHMRGVVFPAPGEYRLQLYAGAGVSHGASHCVESDCRRDVMRKPKPNATSAPGPSFSVEAGAPPERLDQLKMPQTSPLTEVESVAHLLSDKPLRRPNRTRPLPDSKAE